MPAFTLQGTYTGSVCFLNPTFRTLISWILPPPCYVVYEDEYKLFFGGNGTRFRDIAEGREGNTKTIDTKKSTRGTQEKERRNTAPLRAGSRE